MSTEDNNPLAYGVEVLHYTKEQCEAVYSYLDSNGDSITKAFTCVWCDTFDDDQKENAPAILNLIERIYFLKKIEGRNFHRIWDRINES